VTLVAITSLKQRWTQPAGYREVLQVAFPLILSTGSWSVQLFVDRMFLTWYSPNAIAAALPAGMTNWTLLSFFMGTAIYVSTFVAQYFGAGQKERIGASVWQGIYLAPLSMVFVAPFYPLADSIFALFGHAAEVQKLETSYFRILLYSIPMVVVANATSSFFSGLGKTKVVMWVNFLGLAVNLVLDYIFIFGKLGLPAMGIEGAGWATTISVTITAITFFILMIRPKWQNLYNTLAAWRFDRELFLRLLRFGSLSGFQFLIELLAFTAFISMVGSFGTTELAASNIAFNINSLAFMPMYGLSIAVSILVGQRLGENNTDLAERAAWSGFHLGFAFFAFLAALYMFVPELFLWPFKQGDIHKLSVEIEHLTIALLRFVAIYSLFDAGNMIFAGAIKGAGDTKFIALSYLALSWALLIIPSTLYLYFYKQSIYWLWFFVVVYIAALCFLFLWRFMQGKWKDMRVIE